VRGSKVNQRNKSILGGKMRKAKWYAKLTYAIVALGLAVAMFLMLAGPVLAITGVTNTPTPDEVGATATHSVAFTTTITLPISSRIEIDFPSGFDVSAAALSG